MIRTFALTFTLIISHTSVYSLKHIIHDSYFGFRSKQKKTTSSKWVVVRPLKVVNKIDLLTNFTTKNWKFLY